MRRGFVVRITELGQTRFSSMHCKTNCVQFILRFIMAPLQRGLSRAYFTYDRDWGIGLRTTCAMAQLSIFSTFRMMKTSFLSRNKCTKLGF